MLGFLMYCTVSCVVLSAISQLRSRFPAAFLLFLLAIFHPFNLNDE